MSGWNSDGVQQESGIGQNSPRDATPAQKQHLSAARALQSTRSLCPPVFNLWGLKTPGKLHPGETHTKLWDLLLEARPGSHSEYQRKSPQLTTGERGRPGRKGRLLLWTRPACWQKELPRAQPAETPLAPNWPGERETPSPTPTTAALPI